MKIIILCILLLLVLVQGVHASVNFIANPVSGITPLPVSFTDLSSNNPTGWAWFFGDETYIAPWTQMTASAGWSARSYHRSVVMQDGSIILMGGYDNTHTCKNDVWRSTDNGATWTQMTASAGWSARYGQSNVVMPDGSIVLMGGSCENDKNDVWRSTDNGATWTLVTASAGWTARVFPSSVVMPDGSIVLMGGGNGYYYGNKNDVWRSTDNGASWTLVTASAGWSARYRHSSVVMPDGSIVLMGGFFNGNKNDVWRSTDNGATWTQVNASAGWSGKSGHSSNALPDGSIVLMGGYDGNGYKNDVWRSTDKGSTWTQLTASAGWTARDAQSSVVMPDGSIVLMGGGAWVGGGGGPGVESVNNGKNDVWRFIAASSIAKNPSHTYTVPGTYQVALQAYNDEGYTSTRKTGYITVNPLAASFTATPSPTLTASTTVPTTIPTTQHTTAVTTGPTTTFTTVPQTTQTTAVTTGQTTAITSVPTSAPTTGQTTSITTAPTPRPTATVDHAATIAKLEALIAAETAKNKEQDNWIDQILRFLGLK